VGSNEDNVTLRFGQSDNIPQFALRMNLITQVGKMIGNPTTDLLVAHGFRHEIAGNGKSFDPLPQGVFGNWRQTLRTFSFSPLPFARVQESHN
jgi:hypothetical protein